MIFFSIGLPGCVAEWCDAVMARVLGQALGGVESLSANTLQEVAGRLIMHGASHVIVGSRQPDSQVRAALADGHGRFVLALDDPRAAIADMMIVHGYDLPAATRAVASSCAALLRYADFAGALVVKLDRQRQDPVATAAAISTHFGFAADHDAISGTVAALDQAGVTLEPRDITAWWDGLGDAGQALVTGAVGAYLDYFAGGALGKFIWGRELFFAGDTPNEPATGGVDVTGRVRCLLYGPFIVVPPGSWAVHVVLGCSKEAAGMSFMVEAFAGSQLSRITMRPGASGMFETSLGFVIDENTGPADQPFQIRIFNERAAFDGRLGIGSVSLIPQARARPDLRDNLATVIGLAVE